jgi:hypothetical protein
MRPRFSSSQRRITSSHCYRCRLCHLASVLPEREPGGGVAELFVRMEEGASLRPALSAAASCRAEQLFKRLTAVPSHPHQRPSPSEVEAAFGEFIGST